MTAQRTESFLSDLPGHYIRRLQQIAVALFLEETEEFGITPVQFASMVTIREQPDLDQRALARAIGFDAATIGGVLDRLQRRGLVLRQAAEDDRRVRRLRLTPEGAKLLKKMTPGVLSTQERILAPLAAAERERFLKMLRKLVEANNEFSRAPRMELSE
jgi:DNA-binding MarR family transcriptional regulator